MPHRFSIRFTGEGIRPRSVPLQELADLLLAAEQTIVEAVRHEHPEIATSDLVIGLTQVRDESLGLVFEYDHEEEVSATVQNVLRVIEEDALDALPPKSQAGLKEIVSFTKRKNCTAELNFPTTNAPDEPVGHVEIAPDTVLTFPEPFYLRGETAIFGRVERVGGVDPKVRIRYRPDTAMSCRIGVDLAKELGAHLYDQVVLTGSATWNATDYSLEYFRASSLVDFVPKSAAAAMDELRDLCSDDYADVDDVQGYVSSQREEAEV